MYAAGSNARSIAAIPRKELALREPGVLFVGVCHEKVRTIETFAARSAAPYLLLADVTGEVSAMYGLWDRVGARTLPGFILLDPRGVVQFALGGGSVPFEQIVHLVNETVDGS